MSVSTVCRIQHTRLFGLRTCCRQLSVCLGSLRPMAALSQVSFCIPPKQTCYGSRCPITGDGSVNVASASLNVKPC